MASKRERELTKSLGHHRVTWKDRARELAAKGLDNATIAARLGKPTTKVWEALRAPSATDRTSGSESEDAGSIPAERAKGLKLMNEVWTWWCQEDLYGKRPKKTICLHVQRGRQEYEARYDIDIDYYRDNIRHVELPKRTRDILDVIFPETMETWPKVMRFVQLVDAYARQEHGLAGDDDPQGKGT